MKIVGMFLIGSIVFLASDAITIQAEDSKEAAALLEKAAAFYKNGEEVRAVELTLESVKIYEKLGSAYDKDLATAYYRLAMMASGRSEYVSSVAYLRKLLAIEEKVFGAESSEVANTAKTLALSLAMIGKLSESSDQLQRTFDIRLKVYGPRSTEIVDVLEDLCTISMRQNFYDTAKQYGLKALEVQGKLEGVENPRTAHIIVTLGTIASRENNFALAKETLKQGKESAQTFTQLGTGFFCGVIASSCCCVAGCSASLYRQLTLATKATASPSHRSLLDVHLGLLGQSMGSELRRLRSEAL